MSHRTFSYLSVALAIHLMASAVVTQSIQREQPTYEGVVCHVINDSVYEDAGIPVECVRKNEFDPQVLTKRETSSGASRNVIRGIPFIAPKIEPPPPSVPARPYNNPFDPSEPSNDPADPDTNNHPITGDPLPSNDPADPDTNDHPITGNPDNDPTDPNTNNQPNRPTATSRPGNEPFDFDDPQSVPSNPVQKPSKDSVDGPDINPTAFQESTSAGDSSVTTSSTWLTSSSVDTATITASISSSTAISSVHTNTTNTRSSESSSSFSPYLGAASKTGSSILTFAVLGLIGVLFL